METALRNDAASGRQLVRMRRFYLAAGAYAVCVPVLVAAQYVGLLPLGAMLRVAILMLVANAAFFAIFRSGLNQRAPDPSLTWPQVVVATAILMYAVYYFEHERGLALSMCLVVLSFGAFRFSTREFLTASGVVLAGYLVVINVLMWARPSQVNVPIEAYRWLTLALVLPCFSIVGGRISELRRRLRRTNEELNSALQMIQKMATHDALTGLPNRALFNETLVHAIGQAQRHRRPLALFFLDIDRFKNINDTLGHSIGDRVLQEVGRRLTVAVRASDMVARLGGDEFVLLAEGFADSADLSDVAAKILGAFEPSFHVESQELALSASIGICTFPDDGSDAQTLLSNADIAMYRAKEQGRNRHCFYAASLNKLSQERLALEAALRHAVERDEIEIHYQPKIEFGAGRVTGVEALIRWRHPQLGLLLPDRFVPLAEETGVIVPIGYWTLRRVCELVCRWKEQGFALSVAVNLSASQFHQPELVKELAAILWSTGAPAQLLELEITETMVMKDPDRAVAVMEQLRAMGVRLSIDDFGTGHSSLGYLKRFPIDRLKVDRSFVRELPHNGGDAAITRAVIALAHSLKMTVVAEGVEDQQQFDMLREQGCDEFQGYFCRPPLPEAELLRFLSEERGSFNRARPLDSRIAG
ncbi:MAG TPA: EAL domain-containing protein [Usitatibacter sp.]|nr:EAL domain-containing protein [Usitatibacter sp.]